MDGVGLGDVEAAASETLNDVARNGVTDREVAKAKNQLRARLVFENDSVTNIGHQLGYFQTVANVDVYQRSSSPHRSRDAERGQSRRRKISAKRPADDRLVQSGGRFGQMTTALGKGLDAARHVLGNGLVVISKEAHTVPAVTIQVGVKAGSIYDSDALLGLSHLTSRVLDRGTRRRPATRLPRRSTNAACPSSVSANRHVMSVSCTCLSEDFEAMLDLVGEIVSQPAFPGQEIEKRKGEVLNSIRQDEDSPAAMAMLALFAMLYPDGHPYGRPSKGQRRRRQPHPAQRSRRIFTIHASRPSTTTAIIVGDVDRDRAVTAGERVFGNWRKTPARRDRRCRTRRARRRGGNASSR